MRVFKAEGEPPGSVLAIAGGKGGVGRTTTTLGLAAALARGGHRPVAVDADRHGPDLRALARHGRGNPPAAGPPAPLANVEIVGATPGGAAASLRRTLATHATRSRPVLVDCPAGAGPAASVPLRMATQALLVTGDDPTGHRGAATAGSMAESLETRVFGVIRVGVSGDGAPGEPLRWPLLGTVPLVECPLADERAWTAYKAIVDALDRQNA